MPSDLEIARSAVMNPIESIADAAGFGIATVFRHFSTKTALVADISTWIWNR